MGELYGDSVDTHEPYTGDKVAFEPHRGVTPNAFLRVFRKGRRKENDGTAVEWDRETAAPNFGTRYPYPYYVTLEANEVDTLAKALDNVRDKPKPKEWVRAE